MKVRTFIVHRFFMCAMLEPMLPLDTSLWPDTATRADGRLQIGGCDAVELARRWGTPLYVLDEATFVATARRYVKSLHSAYPAPASAHYAGKALLNVAVARLAAASGLGLDCVSLGELAIAKRAGVAISGVHFHGNAKPRRELETALTWGIGRVVVDSLDELRVLDELTRDGTARCRILLRLNPGVDVHTHAHVQTGQLDSKFGLPIATGMAEQAVREALAAPGLDLIGLHAHLGSQISELDRLALGVDRLVAFAAAMRDAWGWTIGELSPGGGLAVPYLDGDPAPGIESYVDVIAQAVVAGCRQHNLALPKLVLEPGRSVVARSMVTLYEVVSIKDIPGTRTFVAVDGGMGDNIRPALYDARYTAVRADRDGDAGPPVTVVGRYCESGDVLLRDVRLPELEAGALLALSMTGAYTLSMASAYNGVPRPALLLVRDGEARLALRRETIDDLLARDVMG